VCEREGGRESGLPVCNIPEDTGYYNIASAGSPTGESDFSGINAQRVCDEYFGKTQVNLANLVNLLS